MDGMMGAFDPMQAMCGGKHEGKLDGYSIPLFSHDPALIMIMAPGGFFVFGLLRAFKKFIELRSTGK